MPPSILIATRGSPLALAQAHLVLKQCRAAFPSRSFDLAVIKTTGDTLQANPTPQGVLSKGLFTKELEAALLDGQAVLAVHSLKDLPTELPSGLTLGAVLERADARDVWIARTRSATPALDAVGGALDLLPSRATVATGSPRRQAQLLHLRPEWRFVDIRGNVGTRLRKLSETTEFDATVLAMAGLHRLGYHVRDDARLEGADVPAGLCAWPLPPNDVVPAVGQAAIGIEIPSGNDTAREICDRLNHASTWHCVAAERAFLQAMGGGCNLAVGAWAQVTTPGRLVMQAVSFLQGGIRRAQGECGAEQGMELGQRLAREIQAGHC